jgi:hypothetical protein
MRMMFEVKNETVRIRTSAICQRKLQTSNTRTFATATPLGLDVNLAIAEGIDIDDNGEVLNVHAPLQGRV